MTGFWIILGDWGYALAAALFTALAIFSSRQGHESPARQPLVIALAITALWALYGLMARSVVGQPSFSGGVAETARNGAWLIVSWLLLRGSASREGLDAAKAVIPAGARPVFIMLMIALGCQLCIDMVASEWVIPIATSLPLFQASWLLRGATALGAIFLLHGLYARLDRDNSNGVGWLGCALTVMWAYEFNHYLLAWLSDGRFLAIGQMRGVVMTLIAPMIMLGTGPRNRRGISLSRRAAYRTVTVALGLLYGLALLAMIMLIRTTDNPAAQIAQIGMAFIFSVLALILLPSAPFRAWLRVEVAKHLFAHRYDYRQEWMRFADTLGSGGGGDGDAGDDALPPHRAARAVAQMLCAPAALLMMRDADGALVPEADWNWPEASAPGHVIDATLADRMQASGWIANLLDPADPMGRRLPGWICEELRAWTLVPLIHRGVLIGAVLLARPPGRDGIDWEDLAMLRVVARQLAVTLSERLQQQAIAEAQRFDEFNRRFAFILHDIKNMISQMSLLAANAERHAENPAFRADMVLTLRETADRMNDLIARLARPDQARPGDRATCDMALVVRTITERAIASGRVVVSGEDRSIVRGDAGHLTQAIAHLVQNAIDATPPDGPPVLMLLSHHAGSDPGPKQNIGSDTAKLAIIDRGCGMNAEFLRDGLFRPFTSTKANGFGLGAHEARALVTAMGGRIDVTSREGEGTEFTLSLPLVAENRPPLPESMSTPMPDRKTG